MRGLAPAFGSIALAMLLAGGIGLVMVSLPVEVGQAATNAKPNLLVVMIDDADPETYNDSGRLKAMTKGEGVYFKNSFVSNPLCCPSRATFLRGQYSHNTGVLSNRPPKGGYETFVARGNHKDNVVIRLKRAGYRTLMVGKYMNGYPCKSTSHPGWDRFIFVAHNEYGESGRCRPIPRGVWKDDLTGDKAAQLIRNQSKLKQPFFAWVNFHAPHWDTMETNFRGYSFNPPNRHLMTRQDAALAPSTARPEEDLSDKPQWVRRRVSSVGVTDKTTLERYHKRRVEMLEGVADNLKKILVALRESGQYKNTYIVFTNDNGFLLGEHSITGKMAPYEESIRVPLTVRGPGIPRGVTREQFVLNNDLAPTLLRWAKTTRPSYMDGRPLQPLLDTSVRRGWRDHVLVEQRGSSPPDYKMVRTQRYAYVEYSTGERELYDVVADPYQEKNIRGTRPEVEARLARGLDALRACKGQACRDAENRSLP